MGSIMCKSKVVTSSLTSAISFLFRNAAATISKGTLPETVFVNPVGKKTKIQKEKPQKAKRELEYEKAMERRYAYVRGGYWTQMFRRILKSDLSLGLLHSQQALKIPIHRVGEH